MGLHRDQPNITNVHFPRLTVINFWGGPGSGKSTLAAGLFNLMKNNDIRCEYVGEYAKDLTYQRDFVALGNQFYVVAKQEMRLWRLRGQVRYALLDSPLGLAAVYAPPEDRVAMDAAVEHLSRRYDHLHVFVQRVKPYQAYGRTQTRLEAEMLDARIRDFLWLARAKGLAYLEVPGSSESIKTVYEHFNLGAEAW